MIPAVYPICCGLDVHKEVISAAILIATESQEPIYLKQEFSAFSHGIRELSAWLKEHNCDIAFMESTGVYWKPIFNIFEQNDIASNVLNAYHVKAVAGKKTDKQDARRIAHLSMHGLVRPSYIPDPTIRALRLLTRSRFKTLSQIRIVKNSISAIMDECNYKFNAVATDLFGTSGMLIINALIKNPACPPQYLTSLVAGKLKKKSEMLSKALDGHLTPQHVFLLSENLQKYYFLTSSLVKTECEIHIFIDENKLSPWIRFLCSLPGIKPISAACILAEIGTDMTKFPDSTHFTSWAGLCPGNNTSAGISKSQAICKSNKYLKSILVQCCWCITRTKNDPLGGYFRKLKMRRGGKRAVIALAHKVLRIIYALFSSNSLYDKDKVFGIGQPNQPVISNTEETCPGVNLADESIDMSPMRKQITNLMLNPILQEPEVIANTMGFSTS